MLHRVSKVAFGGMWVFPGGRVDDDDRRPGDDEAGRGPARRRPGGAGGVRPRRRPGRPRALLPLGAAAHHPAAVLHVVLRGPGQRRRGRRRRRRDPRARVAAGPGGARPPRPRRGRPGPADLGDAARPGRARRRSTRPSRAAAARDPVPHYETRWVTIDGGAVAMWDGDGGYETQRPGPARRPPPPLDARGRLAPRARRDRRRRQLPRRASSHRSMSVRAMLMPGGIIGRSSARYHCASTISRLVDDDVAARPRGLEPDHQRVRERPRLAGDVAHVGDLHPDLLAHLAVHGLLHRLARLDEPGDAAVHRHREGTARASRASLAALDERDDRRRQAREGEQAARRAAAGPLARRRLGGRAAATAEPRRAVPLHELHGSPGERPAQVVDPPVEAHERHEAVDDRRPATPSPSRSTAQQAAPSRVPSTWRGAAGATSSGCSSSTTHLALPDDDGDRTRPVVGQVEHRHEAGLRSREHSSGVDQVGSASWSERTHDDHSGRDEQAGRPGRRPVASRRRRPGR